MNFIHFDFWETLCYEILNLRICIYLVSNFWDPLIKNTNCLLQSISNFKCIHSILMSKYNYYKSISKYDPYKDLNYNFDISVLLTTKIKISYGTKK